MLVIEYATDSQDAAIWLRGRPSYWVFVFSLASVRDFSRFGFVKIKYERRGWMKDITAVAFWHRQGWVEVTCAGELERAPGKHAVQPGDPIPWFEVARALVPVPHGIRREWRLGQERR